MRKVDIVRRIVEETACTTAQADQAVAAILATVKEGLQQGDTVILRRFGTFHVRAKRARVGRNPRSGAAAAIAARRVVRFTASPTLKQVVDGAATAVE
jgi:nucleoid DNA-binding protein